MKFFIFFVTVFLSVCLNANAEQSFLQNAAGITLYSVDDSEELNHEEKPDNWQSRAQEVLVNALSLTGIQYKYGGKSPETGFDCSGFVRYVFSQATNLSLPPTARAISQIGKTVKKDELQPGDLVFFNTLKSAFSHVGIYMGDNKFIHAPSTGKTVRVESMKSSYWAKRFNGAQRLDTEVEKSAINAR
ncbi:C40 family peptidase [Methylotenera versatilis]|uniref:C40 family peptidase n=1 Tax=Methylotenera versatilis TaxID=1055487 RepID=UPI00064551C9|nr:C40 family peptidase [Methylotenera versatilis]